MDDSTRLGLAEGREEVSRGQNADNQWRQDLALAAETYGAATGGGGGK